MMSFALPMQARAERGPMSCGQIRTNRPLTGPIEPSALRTGSTSQPVTPTGKLLVQRLPARTSSTVSTQSGSTRGPRNTNARSGIESRQTSRGPPTNDTAGGRDHAEQALTTFRNLREAEVSRSVFVNSRGPVTIYHDMPSSQPPDNGNGAVPSAVELKTDIHPTHDYNSIVTPPEPSEHPECEVYYKHLLVKKRGSPLWIPGPPTGFPTEYRRNGISIGDVGIIDPATGQFDFLFNIFLPADHEINEGRVPNGFVPLNMSRVKNSITERITYDAGSCVASSSLRRTDSSEFSFQTTGTEGAILIMPDGALTEDLKNHKLVEKYIAANAKSWWAWVESDDWGWNTDNGIQVVVGMDKVSSWGMATFENVEESMQFEFKDGRTTSQGQNLKWKGILSGKAGPPEAEIRDLLTGPDASPLRNQCVFIRTMNVAVSSKARDGLTVQQVCPTCFRESTSQSNRPGEGIVNIQNTQAGLSVSHPSKNLNKYLLEKCPGAEVVITNDSDWMSVITEDDTTMPCAEDIRERVLSSHIICDTEGVVTLEKQTESFARFTSPQNTIAIAAHQTTVEFFDGKDAHVIGRLFPEAPDRCTSGSSGTPVNDKGDKYCRNNVCCTDKPNHLNLNQAEDFKATQMLEKENRIDLESTKSTVANSPGIPITGRCVTHTYWMSYANVYDNYIFYPDVGATFIALSNILILPFLVKWSSNDTTTSTFAKPGVRSCFDAQTYLGSSNEYENGTINADVGGAFVALSNIIINLILPFLVQWSSNITSSIFLLFTQIYPIMLAALFSVRNPNKFLTSFNAHFTVAVAASVYTSSCCHLHRCGVETSLFRKIPSSGAKAMVLWLGLLFPPLLLSVISFSKMTFINSYHCTSMTFPAYLKFLLVSSMFSFDEVGRGPIVGPLHQKGLGLVSIIALWTWGLYLVRRREEIIHHYHVRHQQLVDEDGPGKPPKRRLFRRYIRLVWYVPKVCWDVIHDHHPMMIVSVLCLHWSWTLGTLYHVTFDMRQLSFRNLLSAFATLPCLISLLGIIHQNRRKVQRLFFKIPRFVSGEVCFLMTGKRQWADRQTVYHDYFSWSKRRWVFTLTSWFVATSGHSVWVWSYIRMGTRPGERSVTNEPHGHWNNVTMYISGYMVSIINIFTFLACFDYCQKSFLSPGKRRRSYTRVIHVFTHAFALTLALLVAIVLSVFPIFVPFLAPVIRQEWRWHHECDSFPTEIILNGEANLNLSSTISFYTVTTDVRHKQHLYDFDVSDVLGTKVMQYHTVNIALSQELEPSIKTIFLNTSQHKFMGCSSNFSKEGIRDYVTTPEATCSDVSGSYTENPFLFFSMSTVSPPRISYARTERREYRYKDDAPSFTVRLATADGNLTDTILLRSAVTQRNNHSVMKMCSSGVASADVLRITILGVFMDAMQEYSIFIKRPRVFWF